MSNTWDSDFRKDIRYLFLFFLSFTGTDYEFTYNEPLNDCSKLQIQIKFRVCMQSIYKFENYIEFHLICRFDDSIMMRKYFTWLEINQLLDKILQNRCLICNTQILIKLVRQAKQRSINFQVLKSYLTKKSQLKVQLIQKKSNNFSFKPLMVQTVNQPIVCKKILKVINNVMQMVLMGSLFKVLFIKCLDTHDLSIIVFQNNRYAFSSRYSLRQYTNFQIDSQSSEQFTPLQERFSIPLQLPTRLQQDNQIFYCPEYPSQQNLQENKSSIDLLIIDDFNKEQLEITTIDFTFATDKENIQKKIKNCKNMTQKVLKHYYGRGSKMIEAKTAPKVSKWKYIIAAGFSGNGINVQYQEFREEFICQIPFLKTETEQQTKQVSCKIEVVDISSMKIYNKNREAQVRNNNLRHLLEKSYQ